MSIANTFGMPPMTVRFRYQGQTMNLPWIETKKFVEDVLLSKKEHNFHHVSAIRTTPSNVSQWKGEGPFSALDFGAMMWFSPQLSNEDWLLHMSQYNRVVSRTQTCSVQ